MTSATWTIGVISIPQFLIVSMQLFAQVELLLLPDELSNAFETTSVLDQTDQVFAGDYLEELETLKAQPMALSLAEHKLELLAELHLLSTKELTALRMHLQEYGPMPTKIELLAVAGLPSESGRRILPYVKAVNEDGGTKTVNLAAPQHRLLLRYSQRLEKVAGLIASDSTGSDFGGPGFSSFLKYRFEAGPFNAGLKLQTDAGEAYRFTAGTSESAAQFGFDFTSAFIKWEKPPGPFNQILLGDYEIRLGQGLGFWSGFGFGKGTQLGLSHKSGARLKPYTSLDEDRFLRGFAVSIPMGPAQMDLFFSHKKIDASPTTPAFPSTSTFNDSLPETYTGVYSSSGLHRTVAESAKKSQLGETIAGLALNRKMRSFKIGGYLSGLLFNAAIAAGKAPYQRYKLAGNELYNAGLHYDWETGPLLLFAELAFSKHSYSGLALLQGILISPHPKLDLLLLFRHYGKSYSAPYGKGLGESSSIGNEQGLLNSFRVRFSHKLKLEGNIDQFRFPWLRYRVDRPSTGRELLLKLSYQPQKKQLYYIDFRSERKDRNVTLLDSAGLSNKFTLAYQLTKARFHIELPVASGLRWQLRTSLSKFKQGDRRSVGWMVHTDLRFDKMEQAIKSSLRLALFQTTDWDSRLYAYENDVRESFNIPAFYGQGVRFVWTGRYRLARWIDIEWRYAITNWFDREQNGSGLDTIDGPKRSELKLQLLIKS